VSSSVAGAPRPSPLAASPVSGPPVPDSADQARPAPVLVSAGLPGPAATMLHGDLALPFNFQCTGTFTGFASPVWAIGAD
jgi:hypothetical protein